LNTLKTLILMVVLSMMLLLIGGVIGGLGGIIVALLVALILNVGAYWFSDKVALGMTKSQPITEQDDPELYNIVREQARLAGLPMPRVYEIYTESPNALATGRSPKNAAVAVTTGIRRILSREELSAVLAHEMAHVGNRDALIMAVVATIAGAISMLAMLAQFSAIFGGMFGGREGRDNIIGLLIIAIVMPIAAALVRAAVSRTREFQADATGAHNCGNPLALASALQKLESGSQARPMRVSEGASHLFIVNPLRGANIARLFSTHPPTDERVRRLTSIDITPRF
jgi:heat shock protein HtpX